MHDIAKEKLLITGVTGYIGFKTLTTALSRGYPVRAVVRDEANISKLQNNSALIAGAARNGVLQFVVIPDLLHGEAVFQSLDGITAVIHLASPLAVETDDHHANIIQPAIRMVTTVLEAASRVSTVRRVVLTSSCVTLIPFQWNLKPDSERLYTTDDINTDINTPPSSAMEAYWASKALARVTTKEFVLKNSPHFDFINLLPSVVVGPDDRLLANPSATVENLLEGTRAAVLAPALTSSLNSAFPYVGVPVHVNDVARAHVDAVDGHRIPGNSEYILCSDTPEGVVWDRDVHAITRKDFPAEVASGVLPLGGSLDTVKWRLDASRTEQVFGWKFASFEETARQMIAQYLELKNRCQA